MINYTIADLPDYEEETAVCGNCNSFTTEDVKSRYGGYCLLVNYNEGEDFIEWQNNAFTSAFAICREYREKI